MAGINVGGQGGPELASMLAEVSAAEGRAASAPGGGTTEDELGFLRMTIAACKADLVELLDQLDRGAQEFEREDVQMLVAYLRSEVKMVSSRVQSLIEARQARRRHRLMDRSHS